MPARLTHLCSAACGAMTLPLLTWTEWPTCVCVLVCVRMFVVGLYA